MTAGLSPTNDNDSNVFAVISKTGWFSLKGLINGARGAPLTYDQISGVVVVVVVVVSHALFSANTEPI